MATDAGLEAKKVAGALTSMRIDELISNLAIGIATGQTELDKACMEIAKFMGEARIAFGKKPGRDVPDELSLIELGFTPNFYQFVDTILEVRVAVSSQYEHTQEYELEQTRGFIESKAAQSAYESQQKSGSTVATKSQSYNIGWGTFGTQNSVANRYNSGSSAGSSATSYESKRLNVTTVDAKYASTYNYSVEGSSTIKTKIVPIPPPPVFEERVRAMVQQMKENEERLSLLYEVKAIIPTVISKTQTIGGDPAFAGEGYGAGNAVLAISISAGGLDRTALTHVKAVSLKDAVTELNEEYAKLLTDHWAIINSVAAREVADDAIGLVASNTESILGAFDEQNELKDDADVPTASLVSYIQAIKSELKRFRDKLKDILAALPKTPEEEEAEQQAAGGTA